tara:strand:+ start:166 stop:306 length:141 start_codon:yes stop_codon:yes gene_type:complete
MPSMTPSLGFFFHLRARLWGRGGGVLADASLVAATIEARQVEGSAK